MAIQTQTSHVPFPNVRWIRLRTMRFLFSSSIRVPHDIDIALPAPDLSEGAAEVIAGCRAMGRVARSPYHHQE